MKSRHEKVVEIKTIEIVRGVLVALLVLVIVAIYISSSRDKTTDATEMKPNQVGYHKVIRYGSDYAIYSLVTPRGVEEVAGGVNLNKSIETYRKNGTLGKEINIK